MGEGWRWQAFAGQEARRELDRAVQLAPESVSLLLAGGEVAFLLGDIAAVRDHALRAVAAESTSAAACDLLARAELAAGSLDAALESARRARALDKSEDIDLLRLNAQLEQVDVLDLSSARTGTEFKRRVGDPAASSARASRSPTAALVNSAATARST